MTAADAAVTPVLEALEAAAIVPVVVIDDAGRAPDLVAALVAGGIRCAEITLRTPAGLGAIAAVAGTPGFLLGAGTVLSIADVDAAADAGAEFVVSPGFDESIVQHAQDRGILALPGVATATEVQWARRAGLTAVKFFPADRLGGLATISALAAPLAGMRFMPSGGVGLRNGAEYLASKAVLAISGSWMVPRAAIADGDFSRIEQLSREAAALIAHRPTAVAGPARPGHAAV